MKCMMSASVEIIFYWAWLITSVRENEPKLKETTVNHFALRHYWWIEVYTCSEHSESVKQYARIVWASLISSLEVARYDSLPHRFSPTFQPLKKGCIKIAMIAFVDAFCAGKRQWTTSRHSYQLHLLSRHLAALTMNNSAICFTL